MPTQPRRSSDSRAARRAHRQPMQRRERGSRSTVFAGLIQGDTKKGRKMIGENSEKRVCTIEQVHKHGISSQKDQRAYIKPKWRIVGGWGVARCVAACAALQYSALNVPKLYIYCGPSVKCMAQGKSRGPCIKCTRFATLALTRFSS